MPREDTIIIHHSITSGAVPSGLSLGEIAANTVDQKFYVGISGSTAAPLSPFTSGNSISSTRYDTSNASIPVPDGAVLLEIVGCGGGGGGAGGSVRISGNAAQAGGGGQGGQGERVVLRLEDAGITAGVSTVGVTVGAGGLGGASRNATANLRGNTGADGGNTTVYRISDGGLIIEFPGGEGGLSPNQTTAAQVRRAFTHSFMGKISGLGGQGARADASRATAAGNSKWGGGGGGGGAGSLATSGGSTFGGTGGNANYWITFPAVTTNVNGGTAGVSGAAVFNGGNGLTSAYGGGGGGGGWRGRVDSTDATEATYYGFTAGRGGEGGAGGGGGGGGGPMNVHIVGAGGVTANYASGPGGTGGNGYVILTWW